MNYRRFNPHTIAVSVEPIGVVGFILRSNYGRTTQRVDL